MKVNFVDAEGRCRLRDMSRDTVIAAALKELLLSHDHLYRSVFRGTSAKPHWDIAAKNGRRVYKALVGGKLIPRLTIECEFLQRKKAGK